MAGLCYHGVLTGFRRNTNGSTGFCSGLFFWATNPNGCNCPLETEEHYGAAPDEIELKYSLLDWDGEHPMRAVTGFIQVRGRLNNEIINRWKSETGRDTSAQPPPLPVRTPDGRFCPARATRRS
jgi:hypothetical protein